MILLNSSCLRGAKYSAAMRQMFIWFHGAGHFFIDYRVPESVLKGLINGICWHGEYYHQFIRGNFRA